MKIIDALKELPVLEKRIQKNTARIQEYSSYGSHVGTAFPTEMNGGHDFQVGEVRSLIDSNIDILDRYMKLRRVLNKTNATIDVTIGDMTMTISEWIAFNTKGYDLLKKTYQALNINKGNEHLKIPANLAAGVAVQIKMCFDEKEKNKQIDRLDEIKDKINATLERINAVTDLVEEI